MPNYESNLYCKLFIDNDCNLDYLILKIKKILDGKIELQTYIYNKYLRIDARENDEYDKVLKNSSYDGFLFYRFILDIYQKENITDEDYINQIKFLIKFLRDQGFKVVPACHFEEKLNL